MIKFEIELAGDEAEALSDAWPAADDEYARGERWSRPDRATQTIAMQIREQMPRPFEVDDVVHTIDPTGLYTDEMIVVAVVLGDMIGSIDNGGIYVWHRSELRAHGPRSHPPFQPFGSRPIGPT